MNALTLHKWDGSLYIVNTGMAAKTLKLWDVMRNFENTGIVIEA